MKRLLFIMKFVLLLKFRILGRARSILIVGNEGVTSFATFWFKPKSRERKER